MHPPRYGSHAVPRGQLACSRSILQRAALNRKLESGQNKLIRVENLKQQQRSKNERTPACMPRAHACMHERARRGRGGGGRARGDGESSSSRTKAKGLSRAWSWAHGGGGHAVAAGPALQVAKPGRLFCPCHTRVRYSLCSSCCRWRSIE